jgi:hypothetical protein
MYETEGPVSGAVAAQVAKMTVDQLLRHRRGAEAVCVTYLLEGKLGDAWVSGWRVVAYDRELAWR